MLVAFFLDGVTLGGETRQHGPGENAGRHVQRQRQR